MTSLPPVVDVEVTGLCNLRCPFCFGPTPCRVNRGPSTEQLLDLFTALVARGVRGVVISGGEPTLRTRLPHELRAAQDAGLSVVLSTNGLKADVVLEAAPALDWLSLPFDAVSAGMQMKMRGMSRSVAELRALVEAAKSRNDRLRVKIGSVATQLNKDEIPGIGLALLRGGVPLDTWKIYEYTPRRRFAERGAELSLLPGEFSQVETATAAALAGAALNVKFSRSSDRRRAYLFVYPDGSVAVPGIGEKDQALGNFYCEGPKVFDAAFEVSAHRHGDNYTKTYGTWG